MTAVMISSHSTRSVVVIRQSAGNVQLENSNKIKTGFQALLLLLMFYFLPVGAYGGQSEMNARTSLTGSSAYACIYMT